VQALTKEVDEYNEKKQELEGSLEDMMNNLRLKG
jgi:tetrahydromethanopterin S-methyltransferase subunit B